MVILRRCVAVLAAVVACVALALAAPAAWADGGGSTPGGIGTSGTAGSTNPGPTSSGTQSSSGVDRTTSVNNCVAYANANSFGQVCGAGGQKITVKDLLQGQPAPQCWDDPMSDAQVVADGYQPVSYGDYYIDTCLSGLEPGSSPWVQPTLKIAQRIIVLPKNPTTCSQPFQSEPDVQCRGILSPPERTVVTDLVGGAHQIPSIVVGPQPSTTVRTGVTTAFQDDATPKKQVGPVGVGTGAVMYAKLSGYSIQPLGAGTQKYPCDGGIQVTSDQAATNPGQPANACWYTYRASSIDQPGDVYKFRAEADWIVYLNNKPFAHFEKYDDLKLPVYDVQSLNIIPS